MTAEVLFTSPYFRMFDRNDNTQSYSCQELFENSMSLIIYRQKLKHLSSHPSLEKDSLCSFFGLQTVAKNNPVIDVGEIN